MAKDIKNNNKKLYFNASTCVHVGIIYRYAHTHRERKDRMIIKIFSHIKTIKRNV